MHGRLGGGGMRHATGMATPESIGLAPGAYTLPGSTYLLVVDGPGCHLRAPASGPPSLLGLVPDGTPSPAPAPAEPTSPTTTAPVTTQTSGTPAWLIVLLGLMIGVSGVLVYGRLSGSSDAVVPAGPATPPGPAPPPPKPPKPDWLGGLESRLDAIVKAAMKPPPAMPPDLTPLLARLDELARKLDRPAAVQAPAPVTAPSPAVYYYTRPQAQCYTVGGRTYCAR